ncbi:MAG: ATP-binding protein [Treponema sp.]|nr:ATP-binding protein [Treponema sp.]
MLPPIPEPPEVCSPAHVGIAVDVGTTTVVVSAWATGTRTMLATAAEQNRQARFGGDVISRIAFASAGDGLSVLHGTIVAQLESLFARVLRTAQAAMPRGISPAVTGIVLTGNTAMLSLLCGVPANGLAAAPFTPASLFDLTTCWGDVRSGTVGGGRGTKTSLTTLAASVIDGGTPVYVPPCVGAFVGADTVCAMLAAGFPVPGECTAAPQLLADIGTNSEIALYVPDTPRLSSRILCTAAAAGPAFEAANISCGMGAADGAIDFVSFVDGRLCCHVIGGGNPRGICGSGVVSAVAALRESGWIDQSGAMQEGFIQRDDGSRAVPLAPAVYLSQQDVRNVQLAKAAVRTGLQYMIAQSPSLPALSLAGAFGTNLPPGAAASIGLIPPELADRTVPVGNAALAGASALLFSPLLRQKCTSLARKSYQINLAAVPDFQARFLDALAL